MAIGDADLVLEICWVLYGVSCETVLEIHRLSHKRHPVSPVTHFQKRRRAQRVFNPSCSLFILVLHSLSLQIQRTVFGVDFNISRQCDKKCCFPPCPSLTPRCAPLQGSGRGWDTQTDCYLCSAQHYILCSAQHHKRIKLLGLLFWLCGIAVSQNVHVYIVQE